MSESVFKNCNVCGRGLIGSAELQFGVCGICANEVENDEETVRVRKRIPTMDKSLSEKIESRAKKLHAAERRWLEEGNKECAAEYQGAAFELELLLPQIRTLEATAAHLASEGWVKLNWRPGTERPPHNGIMVCVSQKGNIWSCENPYYVTEECRWLYASELLGDKSKEGAE